MVIISLLNKKKTYLYDIFELNIDDILYLSYFFVRVLRTKNPSSNSFTFFLS